MIVPHFQYLLVLPNGDIKGFEDIGVAKGYINIYYHIKLRETEAFREFNDLTDSREEVINTVCHNLGVAEGECRVYDNMDIIENIQNELVFDDEKEEIISKLLSSEINLNIYDYSIDNIFNNVDPIDMMEPYGEVVREG